MPPPDVVTAEGEYKAVSEYLIGANDLIEINVFQVAELGRAVRVNTTALVGVLALTILAGYGVSQWDRWRVQFMPTLTLTQGEIEQVADLGAEHAAPVLDATTEAQSDPFIAGLDATLNTNEDELAAFGAWLEARTRGVALQVPRP